MSTKKQMYIIAVLIALIGCAGLFAKKFNNNVKDGSPLAVKTSKKQETTNFFSESRMGKENQRSAAKQEYEKIMNSKDASSEAKNDASQKLVSLVDMTEKENKIENMVKDKGYEDALCYVDENGVELCVKTKDALTDEQVAQITDVIVRTTKFPPTRITVRPVDK